MMVPIIAASMGIAIALLIWGGRDWLRRRFEQDVAWAQEASLRFSPYQANARQRVIMAYVFFVLLLGALIFIAPHPILAVGFWLVLLMLPRLIVEVMWQSRRKKIDKQLPAAISAMCNSIRAGLTLVQALERLADHAPEPIRTDFRVMINRYTYGANLESVIKEAKDRLRLPNFNLFASALLLNRELGGDIAETLQRISTSLDKLHLMRQTVEAHTSEGRTNIKVLMVMPVIMLLMISTIDREGVKMMFTTTPGYILVSIAVALMITGVYFAIQITRTEI